MSGRKRSPRAWRLVFCLTFVSGAAYGGWYDWQHYSPEAPNYQTSLVSRGELLQTVTASGQLNPVVMVDVGSQISGIIQELLVDFNSGVKKGQLIAQIDPATYEANSIQAEGNLASAKAALELAQLDAGRARALRANQLNPQADYDKALADLHQAEATVKIKEGALKNARVDLARCAIYAPIDGLVISRNVNVGQTVAASLSAPTLFVIANDLTKMQIEANVAEADIGLITVGQDTEFSVDAFRGQIFHGNVKQIRNAPKTDQNVVTYGTIIEVSNPELKLKPGMTANVSIIVARRDNALKIANAALRFHPTEGMELKKASLSPAVPAASIKNSAPTGRKKDKHRSERLVYLLPAQVSATNSPAGAGRNLRPLQPVAVKTGINDNTFTEVLDGLSEGDEVVTGLAAAKARSKQTSNPFAPGGKRS